MARKDLAPAFVQPTTPQASFESDNRSNGNRNNDPQRHASYERTSPRTPPSPITRAAKGKAKARSSRSRPALPDSFAPDYATAGVDGSRKRSDSHDLSWSPKNTRDSVVDNMLLSLDHIFVNTPDSPLASASLYATPLQLTSSRTRGHTLSSSISSETSALADDAASRTSNYQNRRHRSNSSSNFQSALGRIDSVRAVDDEQAAGVKLKTYEAQRNIGPEGTMNAKLSTRRKGSKSSGSSSLDFGQMLGGARWQRAIERRSSSFDQGYRDRPPFMIDTNGISQDGPRTGLSENFAYDDHDAAPTPTIRAGPRRVFPSPAASTFPLPSPRVTAQSLPLRRRNSKKSPAALFSRHEKTHTRMNSQDTANTPLTPSYGTVVSSRKPSVAPGQGLSGTGNEKPGFFRRVFGNSRNNTPTSQDIRTALRLTPGGYHGSRAESRSGQAANTAALTRPPKSAPPDVPATPREVHPATLNKKASFFRRRKKSISEDVPLPRPPIQVPPDLSVTPQVMAAEKSPVSSLREVMTPYLSSPVSSSHLQGGKDPLQSICASSGFPDLSTPDHPSSTAHDVYTRLDEVGSSERPVPGPMRDNPNASEYTSHINPESAEPARGPVSISSGQPDDLGRDVPGLVSMSVEFTQTPHVMSAKENGHWPTSSSHSRAGSNKGLPRTPGDLPPSSIRDNNVQSSNYGSTMPIRAVSQDTDDAENLLSPANGDMSPKVSTPRSYVTKPSKLPLAHESHESIVSDYKSATSKLPTPTVDNAPQATIQPTEPTSPIDPQELDETEPTEDDRVQARNIYDGRDQFVDVANAAAWLGENGPEHKRLRKAYMELFDWHGLNILAALRILCNRLLLKGETQQVDRILDAFSVRWCSCNPFHGFKATDVVHTICYSILLLNTDLHMADIDRKMTRSEFIRNTMPTIRRVASDAAPNSFDIGGGSMLPPSRSQHAEPPSPSLRAATIPPDARDARSSTEMYRPVDRLLPRLSDHSGIEGSHNNGPVVPESEAQIDNCGPLVMAPFNGRLSAWEYQVEIVLKNFYNAIRQQRLPLSGSDEVGRPTDPAPSTSNLSTFTSGMLRRTPSMLSKAGSEGQTGRGRLLEARMANSRWASKPRSRPRLYPSSIVPSNRTSFDDESSGLSPSSSSIWSKYSLGKTQTSMSVNSFSSSFPHTDYQQSIGFANALSQAIIREETSGTSNAEESLKAAALLEDESLELSGAPWAKEGILKHKHHLESVDKKAKDRHWNECFAVIEKGWMRLFQFNMNSKSMRLKAKNQKLPGGVVGGGNWTENAEALGKFLLRQTIASALPPPGYSKLRPHVWALSLPTGAVHLFQVGTPEIVKEFVTTANYWSARLSKEPLIGGVSNIEYGWGENVINHALVPIETRPPSNLGNHSHRPSLQSSLRSSLDQGSMRPKLPGDRVIISDWTPPQQSMMASNLMEVDQLKALTAYVKSIEEELQKHNQLRGAMLLAFSPRHPNHNKAMSNWERKSSYLLREIVKFRTYIDCLQAAQAQKEKVIYERAPPAVEKLAEGMDTNPEKGTETKKDIRSETETHMEAAVMA